jgi:hypothetical protein
VPPDSVAESEIAAVPSEPSCAPVAVVTTAGVRGVTTERSLLVPVVRPQAVSAIAELFVSPVYWTDQ